MHNPQSKAYKNADTFSSSPSSQSVPGDFALGVDGGGSKTLAILVDSEGQECGRGMAGSANIANVGVTEAVSNIQQAIQQALQTAGEQSVIAQAWFGLAGVDRPADHQLLWPHLKPLARQVQVTNDAQLLLSACPQAVGIALITGTGSIAYGRDKSGRMTRAGGWGHLLGDEGSGYDLAQRALQAAVRAADGRERPTLLLDRILQHWALEKPEELIGTVYQQNDKAHIARLVPVVFQAAQDGDERASALLRYGANELALLVNTVARGLDFSEADDFWLALGGSLLLQVEAYRTAVLEAIARYCMPAHIVLVEEPALSAARAALTLNNTIDEREISDEI